ncbi:Cof-type HAD-IIB family hydrolase [Microbacterium allomyrinae]|uniref:Cof-type HAD-IIB family hydrolase n=1 Tax=Microbacterium allomyrinae TaxID=2830666 RepID=A0A9X1LTK4_9MICO|nr:Cof-type HAD-IIB family hydrolase [Microbacterium allomyrinae]MCC2031719.1 Cof-type HAD-IIB family hydrolase [Microbacterium allomyrinae]
MTHPRIVFLDVDGTLIDHSQRLAPAVVQAVRGARASGHLVYLSTGRSRVEIPDFVTEIGFDGVISAGGGFIEHGDDLLAAHTMPEPVVRDLVGFFERHDIEYTLQAYESAHPSKGLLTRMQPLFTELGFDSARGERLVETMTYRGPAPTSGIAKATFFGTDPRTFSVVRDGLGDRFHVITGTIPYLGEAGGEVSLGGIHKGAAITQLVRALGLDIADSIAIGDSTNDLEMLEAAGVGIAMGNADAAVKAIADEITTAVDDDGVARAFARHGLV